MVMASEDTAVVGDDNAPPPETPEVTAESVLGEGGTEPVSPEPTETPRFDDLSDEEKAENPWVKDFVARREESMRQRAQVDQVRITQQWASRNGATRELERIVRQAVDDEEKSINAKDVDEVAGGLVIASIGAALDQFHESLEMAGIPGDKLRLLTDLHDAAKTNIGRHGNAYVKAALEAYAESQKPKYRSEWEAETKAKAQTQQKAEQVKQADAVRAGAPRPTSVAGGASSKSMSWADIDKKYTDSQWMGMPAEERKRLADAADQLARQ